MIIYDKIYGKSTITEPVLVELIKSKPLQRLKGIAQLGVPNRYYHINGPSRFEHSLGVMLLLKRLNVSLEEQIAGLLHDISHTAFSHVVDWAIGDQTKEDHQDKNHKSFFQPGEISSILRKYGFKPERISNFKNFKLLEREIPDLCADRIDYALEEFYSWANSKSVKSTIENLKNIEGRIVFGDFNSAYIFAMTFLKCQKEHWGGYEAIARYYLFSSILKDALNKKILSFKDFYQDDKFVMNRLVKSGDKKILGILRILENKKLERKIKEGKSLIIKKKFRYVDPEFLMKGKIKRLSQMSERFKILLEKEKLLNQKGVEVFLDIK